MSHAVDIYYKENNMTYIKKILYATVGLVAGGSAIAASGDPIVPLIEYAEADQLSAAISALQGIAVAVGAAFVLLALTRMVYRKVRGIAS